MSKIFLFSNSFDDTFGGMEEHRKAFVSYFEKDVDYDLFLLSNADSKYVIATSGESIAFGTINDCIAYMKKIVNIGDVFFFNDFRWVNDMELLKANFSSIKFVVRSGGNDILRAPVYTDDVSLSVRQHKLVEIINRNVDCLIVNSDYSYLVNRRIGINPLLMKKIRGGVDSTEVEDLIVARSSNRAQFDAKYGTQNKKLITLACRLVPFKGIIEFLTQIKDHFRYDEWMLLVIGNGPLLKQIRDYLNEHFNNQHILIEGTSHLNTLQYISISDVIVNPSIYYQRYFGDEWFYHTETMGRTMIEAIALNVPIIGTNVGGTSELFYENAKRNIGYLVEDFSDFSMQMDRLLEKCEQFDYSDMYSWRRIFEKYKTIFANAGKKVYCFDLDGTIVDRSTSEQDVCSTLRACKGESIIILNTARKNLEECQQFFEDSNADYMVYNNGVSILAKDGTVYTQPYSDYAQEFSELNSFETILAARVGAEKIERTHVNCLSIKKDDETLSVVKTLKLQYDSLELIVGDALIKVINRNINKKQGLLYVLKDIFCKELIVAGDATNDIPFLKIGDVIYSEKGIAHFFGRTHFAFEKNDNKLELIRRMFCE